ISSCCSAWSARDTAGSSCSTSRRTRRRSKMTRTRSALLSLALALAAAPGLAAQEDREAIRKTYVGLEITLRKKTRLEKAELEEESLDAEAQRLYQLSENEQPLEAWGLAVEKGLILMADKTLKESDVERIRATDSTGASFDV